MNERDPRGDLTIYEDTADRLERSIDIQLSNIAAILSQRMFPFK